MQKCFWLTTSGQMLELVVEERAIHYLLREGFKIVGIFDEIRQAASEIEKAVVQLSLSTKALPLRAAMEEIRSLGLQLGFETSNPNTPDMTDFFSRLSADREQKERLAEFLCRRDFQNGKYPSLMFGRPRDKHVRESKSRPFFECGSTIAFVIGQFARDLSKLRFQDANTILMHEPELDIVLSNNMFCGSSLANLVTEVVTVSGYLSTKYAGHLPCPESWGNEPTGAATIRSSFEMKFYNRLCEDIATCDRILATCSNFSFVAGPLVGSRANAIAKHAIGSARNSKCDYATCFTFAKLLPITTLPSEIGASAHAINGIENCRIVFPRGNSENIEVDAIDSVWHRNLFQRKVRAEFEEFQEQISQSFSDGALRTSARSTWGDVARDAYVIVSLPMEKGELIKIWLKNSELPAAERIMEQLKLPLKFELSDNTPPNIAEVLMHK